jgi:hypothetical protein
MTMMFDARLVPPSASLFVPQPCIGTTKLKRATLLLAPTYLIFGLLFFGRMVGEL